MSKARILIVEDDADINALLAKIVAREGFGCVQAYSGTEALLQMAGVVQRHRRNASGAHHPALRRSPHHLTRYALSTPSPRWRANT